MSLRSTLSLLLLAGCSDPVQMMPKPDMAMQGPDLAMANPVALACADSIASVYMTPVGLPAWDASHRGDIVKCARDRSLSAAEVNAAATGGGYKGPPLQSGVTIYRIAYRTQRVTGGAGAPDGISSALVLIPDNPRPGVLVVAGHGTIGMAPKCVPSLDDLTVPPINSGDLLALGPAGYGYTTIATDYAGFGYGSTSGWLLTEDEAHSLLDATRAMKQLLAPGALPPNVVITGHSQGGHAALSAQALASTYGLEGKLVGVVGFAPLWVAQRSWGAALGVGLDTKNDATILAFQLLYFYGHGELYDGAGKGVSILQAAKQAAAQTLLANECLDEVIKQLPSLGATPADYFDPTFNADITDCGLLDSCGSKLATDWKKRWAADRPTIDVKGAPIVVWHGLMDGTITPARAQCGFDKLAADLKAGTGPTATVTVCSDPASDHGGVVRADMDWVNQWIDARANGKPEPPACASWSPLTCATPPPNTD